MIAIQKTNNSFFEEWKQYCDSNNISYKVVDFKDPDFLNQLRTCHALLWHHQHSLPHDLIVAKQILFAVESAGIPVFPTYADNWHFDDKLGQHYLLNLLNIKVPRTWVFYSMEALRSCTQELTYPLVLKLRNGAGSRNVKLIKDQDQLMMIARQLLGRGIRQYDAWGGVREVWRKKLLKKASWRDVVKAMAHILYPLSIEKVAGKAWGYVYVQEYIPSDADYRVIVIGNRAFAIKRLVRTNDFRASGSGFILYERSLFSTELIRYAFELSKKLRSDSIAYDFVYQNNEPVLLEISYGWNKRGYTSCPGYWDSDLTWHEGSFDPYGWMVELMNSKTL